MDTPSDSHMDDDIQVVIRVRPWNDTEKAAGTVPVVHTDNQSKAVSVVRRGERVKQTRYTGFKEVLTAFTSQREVYDVSVRPLVDEVLLGYSCTAFAYGQTGTGKTWTMEGDISLSENWGVIPRSAQQIFDTLNEEGRFEDSRVTVSFLEIYNEELCDLLLASEVKDVERPKLRIVEDKARGVFCMGLSEQEVVSIEEVMDLLQYSEEHRRIEETRMNRKSSRSHCLFTVTVTAREVVAGDGGMVMERTGRLHLVDLAGSESAKTAGGSEDRGRERKSINQSLLALGRVITALQALSASKDTSDLSGRVPYRESKLTRLLQDALGGRSRTCLIATCSPSELAVDETVSTLGYAQRASGIRNKPSNQNQLMSGSGRSLSPGHSMSGLNGVGAPSPADWASMELRLAYMDTQVREAQHELARQFDLQREASARAIAAEDKLTGLEDSVEEERAEVCRQEARVALLHVRLGKRHVHVRELRTLLRAHSDTETELQEHARDLLSTLRASVSQGEGLQRTLEGDAIDSETRRGATHAFAESHLEAISKLRTRVGDFTQSDADARAAFALALSTAASSHLASAESVRGSLSAVQQRVASEADAVAEAIRSEVSASASASEKLLASAQAAAGEAVVLVGQHAAGVNGRIVNLLRDVDASETSLLSWADATCVATTANGEGLSARSDRESGLILEAAEAMDRRHEHLSLRIDDDTAALETLLGGLGEHANAAGAQAESAAEAAGAASQALEDARGRFQSCAGALKSTVGGQRRGQADEASLEESRQATAAIASAAARHASALSSDALAIAETSALVVNLVEEQKATQRALVDAVVAQVRSSLEEQTQALGTRLDAAVSVINGRHAAMAAANSALASDVAHTLAHLTQSCAKNKAVVEGWRDSDKGAAAAVDETIASLELANEIAAADAAAVAAKHKTSEAEAEDLQSRTSDETAAVAALKDSSVAAAASAVEARTEAAAAMDARTNAAEEWREADEMATSALLSSLDALKAEVRGDFLHRVEGTAEDTREALTNDLVSALALKLEENHKGLSSSVAARISYWHEFAAASKKSLVGDNDAGGGVGLSPRLAEDCAAMQRELDGTSAAVVAAAEESTQRLRAMGVHAASVDSDVDRRVEEMRGSASRFAQDVARVDSPVPMPQPLLPTVYSTAVASTQAHADILDGLHRGNAAATEDEMLQRVASLLDKHHEAVTRGQLPFHEPSENETAEGSGTDEEEETSDRSHSAPSSPISPTSPGSPRRGDSCGSGARL